MQGWVKLHRQFTEWEWYTDDKCFRLFIHLLLKCNHKTVKWRGETIERGQTISSIGKLAIEVGMTPQTLRTTLKKLESTGEIVKKSTSKLTKITVCNYSSYQEDQQTNQQTTNKPLTNDQQQTRMIKNEENDNNNTVATQRGENAKAVFDYWNQIRSQVPAATLPQARSVTDALARSVNGMITEKFTVEEIKRGINNYAYGLADPNYFFKHRWTLQDFIKRGGGCRKFSDMTEAEAQAQRGGGSKYGNDIPI